MRLSEGDGRWFSLTVDPMSFPMVLLDKKIHIYGPTLIVCGVSKGISSFDQGLTLCRRGRD